MLNRGLQLQILEHLKNFYTAEPGSSKITEQAFAKDPNFNINLKYLYEHGLIHGLRSHTSLGIPFQVTTVSITKDGLDFLEDDGGLSAIFKTVTVKFDIENIKMIIEDKVINSALKEEEKTTLINKIKNFSGEALKEFMIELLKKGLENPQILMHLIR